MNLAEAIASQRQHAVDNEDKPKGVKTTVRRQINRGPYNEAWKEIEPWALEEPRYADEILDRIESLCGRRPTHSTLTAWSERVFATVLRRQPSRTRVPNALAAALCLLPKTERLAACIAAGVPMEEQDLRNILKEHKRRAKKHRAGILI